MGDFSLFEKINGLLDSSLPFEFKTGCACVSIM